MPRGNRTFFEYVFDMDPWVSSDYGAPCITRLTDSRGDFLLMDYNLPINRTGFKLHIEVSSDMNTWDDSSGAGVEVWKGILGGRQHRQVRSTLAGEAGLFMRMRVSLAF